MEFHPKSIPVCKTYDITDEKGASDAVDEMVRRGFKDRKDGFRVLMPKADSKMAKRIGYTITTGVTHGLRQANEARDIKYWTYHHDADHYGIVLVGRKTLEDLGIDA